MTVDVEALRRQGGEIAAEIRRLEHQLADIERQIDTVETDERRKRDKAWAADKRRAADTEAVVDKMLAAARLKGPAAVAELKAEMQAALERAGV